MLVAKLSSFFERNEKYKQRFSSEGSQQLEDHRILEILCEFLMQPECTEDVADCFPEFLPALVSLAISTSDRSIQSALIDKDIVHRLNCVILGKLLLANQDLLKTFVLHYFDVNPAPFEFHDTNSSETATPAKRRNTKKLSYNVSTVSEYDIVIACYNILQSAVSHFKHKWNWSKFYKYVTNADDRVKWAALKCIAIVLNMSELTKLLCAQAFIPNFEKFLTDYEDKKIDNRIACASFESMENIVKNISSIISVSGILLPTLGNNQSSHNLVPVPSMMKNIQSLAMAIGSRKCICLQGPVGCGKTALVEYLAKITGHDMSNFVKVQLGDQTDSKMLLGMYKCTDVPGEFVWQPGVLTQAVIAGKWLLLEDIDSAALDIISVLSNLMETGTLCVPGYRDTVYANSRFQLFVTRRLMISTTGIQKHVTGSLSLLQKHWLCLNMESLSKDELVTVVGTLFPKLTTIATRIVDVFLLFSVGHHDNENDTNNTITLLKIGRQTSTRDLLKWCSRAIVDFDVSSPNTALKIYQDALDIFCYSVSDKSQRLNLAKMVAGKLGIVETKAEFFCDLHKPIIDLRSNVLIAGRAQLPRKKAQNFQRMHIENINFSFTRLSACLLERIASCIMQKEPVLLVGETGTGKTSAVQYLAKSTNHKLTIINMNQQSDSIDLLGGYKPVDLKFLVSPVLNEFNDLFDIYFKKEPNKKWLENLFLSYKQENWNRVLAYMFRATHVGVTKQTEKLKELLALKDKPSIELYEKKRKNLDMLKRWKNIRNKLNKLKSQVKSHFAFSFMEGSLIKALRNGDWVLLDEINLASAETLECLSSLLENSSEPLLYEHGEGELVKKHPDFTVFACMNPATDVGKKDLPIGLRNRFTEFYIDELTARPDLRLLVNSYLKTLDIPVKMHEEIVKFYLNVRKEATNTLFDGTAHKPHYSLRTLCRALYISASNPCSNLQRSLYEAFSLSFLTQLDYNSYPIVQEMITKAILHNQNAKAFLGNRIPKLKCSPDEQYIYIEGYWILQGSLTPEVPSNYILTDSIRKNLKDLVRAVSIGKIPVLLQGDTSVGKTSLITYLAKITGHVCVRINNHEHTDLEEYVGNYIADETGKLVFKEGILVDAMRKGYWIILDELNLAPSDVLEALNRVLDDNRELFISETQQVVKAHKHFMLFATQNPPGLYGGRKVLSRAFRNRFVELHFDEIPPNELQIILHKRCDMPESYCKQVIDVMMELQIRRKSTAAFAGKKGFITLRDLFRWGERYRLADVGNTFYDWNQHMADEGYLVLAAKVRRAEEADQIRQVIKKHLKRDVDPNNLFTLNDKTSLVTRHILEKILNNKIPGFEHIVWTYHMRRMAVLVKKSCQFKEPVLLVGETGGGKTTVCQLIAAINGQTMRSVNCHMHTESSDFLGNLRPVRERAEGDKRLFEWVDGSVINAMRNGDLFLADEISLADDSVLERLNSLLEPERSLLLPERGIEASHGEGNAVIVADEKFVFIGTMNPGGDYGKKELSPALRNRFTEVWCEGCMARDDWCDIIVHNLRIDSQSTKESVATAILKFTEWLHMTEVGKKFIVTIRDVLTWVDFINTCTQCDALVSKLTVEEAYYHGACLTYIDSLGSGCTGSESTSKLRDFAEAALRFIRLEVKNIRSDLNVETSRVNEVVIDTSDVFGISPFYIKKSLSSSENYAFTFTTPVTKLNTLKLLRALQLNKPILLEGSPGVGKTSLVSALAKAAGQTLLRINLSDQTDVSDLFGTDLPVEGGEGGEFAWRDGPFLRALRAGYWILLDELNLASQSVLEGLNACFDHRGEIYIPELGKTFSVKPGTRLFGCQNPLRQGGARRGLPKSFLNRFTQVSIEALMEDDLKFIIGVQFPQLPTHLINDMVQFNSKLASEIGVVWGHAGSPWEMNLRDITRWCEMTIKAASNKFRNDKQYFNPSDSVELIYVNRMRTNEDRQKIYHIYQEMFSSEKYPLPPNQLPMHITADEIFVGDMMLNRKNCYADEDCNLLVLRDQKTILKSLMQCVKMNWMSILVGPSGCGKSNVVRLLATLTGQKLRSIAMNSAMDTTEILGGFEQTDYNRHLEQLFERVTTLLMDSLQTKIAIDKLDQVVELHEHLEQVRHLFDENVTDKTMAAERTHFLEKVEKLSKLVSAIKLWESSRELELQDIESRLENLSISVEKEGCLNAGGKFEWVDSVLVKCLQDGTWLLIDQVNLCSPAVLDRLNGLLEPNGVLSIGERGVDSEGNVITIKPHENFRLFLTMDPRYGEISRAMRNRGVEIYMFGPKENIYDDVIDLKSLLYNAGILRSTNCDALLEIYDRMSKEMITVDRFSMVDLLQTAFLTKQRSLRGFSAEQSIRNACIDVYIKARSMRDSRSREYLISLIDEAIDRHISNNEEISVIDLNAATWSVKNLQDNSRLTLIRQQSLLLKAAVNVCELGLKSTPENIQKNIVTSKLLNDFCGFKEDEEYILNVDVNEILPYFLLNFYEQSSREDAPLRKKWISRMLRENTIFSELEKQNALMANVIALFRFRSANVKSLPWDLRQLVGRMADEDVSCNDANKLLLLLYARSTILKNDIREVKILQDENVISVKQYSSIVHDGKLFSQLKNQPLITYFVQFVERANSYIETILRDSDINMNSEEYVELRRELKWYTRFETLGEMTLINKLKKSKSKFTNLKQISSLLKVHYKWLLKFLRKLFTIAGQFPNEKTASEIELWEIVSQVNNQLDSVFDPIKKISKRIKKYLILPPPHSSESCMNVHSELRRLTKDFNVKNEGGTGLQKQELKIISVQLKDALSMRHQMISLWSDVYSRKPIDEMTSIVEVEQFCEKSHIRLRVSADIENVLNKVRSLPEKEITQLNAKIHLWPIHEYVFMLFACRLQAEICQEGTISAATLIECLARFADVPSIPSNLIGLLNAITRAEIEYTQKILLLPQLFYQLAQFARQSYAVKNTNRFLHWHGITEEDMEGSQTSYVESKTESYFGGAVLLNLVLQLMLNKTNGEKERKNVLSAVALGTYTAQIDQLQLLNEILWRNSISLTNKRYDLINSDLITLKFYLRLYLSAIDRMNAEDDVPDLIAKAIEKQGGSNAIEIRNRMQTDYFQPIEEFRKVCNEINSIDETSIGEEEDIILRGRAWMLLGYIQLLIFGNLDLIDPVYKVELKLKYLEEDVVDCKRTIYVTSLQNRILGLSAENEYAHPRIVVTKNCEKNLLKMKDKLSSLKAFRSPSVSFASLSKDCANFRNQIGSYKMVKKHMSNLCAIASQECELANFLTFNTVLEETKIWSLSLQGFTEQIEAKYFSVYPDVILPLLTALAQLNHGIDVLSNEIRRRISLHINGMVNLETIIYNLIRFPTIGQGQESLLNLRDLCVSRSTRGLIENSDAFVKMQKQFQIFKSGLYELQNHIILNKGLTKALWRDANELLQQIVLIWKQQQQEEEKRAAERDSLYKNKIESYGSTLTEEQELALEVRKLFPTHRERDFHDIENDSQSSFNQNNALPPKSNESESTFSGLITKDDIKEIQEIHSNIVTSFITSKWICNNSTSVCSTDYVGPLIQRYNIIHGMLDHVLPSLSEDLTIKLYNSLNLLVTLGLQASEEENAARILRENSGQTKAYDFYKECNIKEAKECLPLCETILNRVNQLLKEWPEHPVLKSIRCIIERIYTFSITSPISRFLTGLELLFVKMKQWEDNAHSGVSMKDYILVLTQQIISWRKLELSCWKGCLDATYEDLRSNTSKWWFFLYALIESYNKKTVKSDIERMNANDEIVTRKKLVESVERFMNESSLVEFESRLNLLLTFHCHVYYFDDSDVKNELSAVLWNIYNYYKQFVDDVNARIAALKTPIKKKLEDYVKIARWNELNYWMVKETVDKTHRTLHKYVKEFQKALKQSVSSCLIIKSGSYNTEIKQQGIWDVQEHHKYMINFEDFIVEKPSQFMEVKTLFTSGLILRADTLLTTAKNLCKEIILTSSYPGIRSELENFVMSFMEQSARLRDMNVDRSLPKGKQKSQAKSILQQKRMTLANYFKALTQMGVSYRTGALTLKNNTDKVIDYTVSPLNLSTIDRYFKLKNTDQHMLRQWQGCEKYYYKSLIRLNALNAMLSTSQTDLGLQNMERCRGYSAHMMLMAHRQKMTLARSFDQFSSLRIQISNLSEMRKEDLNISKQHNGQDCVKSLKTLLITLEAGFEQLLLFLQCCPTESPADSNRAVLTLNANALPIIAISQTDQVWKSANTLLEDSLKSIKATVKRFHILFMPFEILPVDHSEDSIHALLSSKHFEFLENCYATIENVRLQAKQLKQLFENSDVVHPICENIAFLDTKMDCFLRDYDENLRQFVEDEVQLKESSNAVEQYELALEQLINMILLIIQKKYKDYINLNNDVTRSNEKSNEENNENNENNENDRNVDEKIEDNGLNEKLVKFLERDITELKLSKVSNSFFNLLLLIHKFDLQSANYCIGLLLKCLPLLEQYLLFTQFYLHEQVASFRITCKMLYLQLNVFLDLAANGFCVPKDLDLDEAETDESGEKTGKGGMGLADGEGTKDVSDQIESEDQLEDARPADQEQEKQNDKMCKEEEKGIDMSEDFDSKPQDMEKDDDDDDEEQSDDDENNDLDKEMGETGEGAEQLDKQIWGDDKEESEENNQQSENEDEEEGTGEQIGEKEIDAKDDEDKRKQYDDNDTNDKGEEEKEKEINELNEPEIDEDQINPHHGKFQPQPEPQQLDLPEDINLDEEDKEDNGEEENPFDIDEMKDSELLPENMDMELEKETAENEENDEGESSEDEDKNCENMDLDKTQEELETNQEAKENDKENAGTENTDEEQNRDEETEEEKLEKAAPSANDASKQMDAAQQVEETMEGSRDTVAQQSNKANDQQETSAENTQEDSNDNGTGQSESQQENGHSGSSKQEIIPASQRNNMTKSIEKRKNLGKSNEDRSLLNKLEPRLKKLKTMYTQDEVSKEEKEDDSSNADGDKAELAKHVKDSEKFDDYTLDAATEDQVREQASNIDKEKENQEEKKDDVMDVEMHEDEENNMTDNKIKEQRPEKISETSNDKRKDSEGKRNNIENNQETMIELEGDIIETMRVQRGNETTFHTMEWNMEENYLDSNYMEKKRFEVENMLAEWTQIPSTEEAAVAWNCLCSVTDVAARDLSEKLRLVLEPTQASRLRGDYKTGKRINMRKIIPYIASQFRKDKIWLRRTKPFKRDYQIILALDDSSSMADNHSKELAFESLSLISKAMTYLEVGQLGVVSFGERVKLLHPLGEAFTEQSGSRLIQEVRFDQRKTMIGQLVNSVVNMFENQCTSSDNAKLLVVLSDGRGIFSEGIKTVNDAIRRAKLANIFLVFIAVDNPINKDSILDIRKPIFEGSKVRFQSYMDSFPFPFYIILRDINTLPGVLSDALRQWFEIVGKMDT